MLIEIDRGVEEPLPVMRKLVAKHNLAHAVLWDNDNRNNKTYGLNAWPISYLIDVDGKVFWEGNLARVVNRSKKVTELRQRIESELRRVP